MDPMSDFSVVVFVVVVVVVVVMVVAVVFASTAAVVVVVVVAAAIAVIAVVDEEDVIVVIVVDGVGPLEDDLDPDCIMFCVVCVVAFSAATFLLLLGVVLFLAPFIFNEKQDLLIRFILRARIIPPDCLPIVQNLLLTVELQMQSHGLTQRPSGGHPG
jgi:hypothetical protein